MFAALKRTVKQFSQDNVSDWAAALTYYGVLSIFPGLLVIVSLLGMLSSNAIPVQRVFERRLMASEKMGRDTGFVVIPPRVPCLPEQRSCRHCIAVDSHAGGTEPYNSTVAVNHLHVASGVRNAHTILMTTFPVARPDSE